jgi:hypothetical protein
MKKVTFFQMIMVLFLCMSLAVPPGLMAQGAKEEAAKQEGAPAFRPEEIDQLMAPIALYPDSLLAQVLVASTYPLEIVQAARFVQQNKELKGEKLKAVAKDKEWDPSVKAMLEFPEVLTTMNEKLEWTQKLGDAFLAQQKDVMDSAQRLRKKAQESGNLKTTKEQVVKVEKDPQVIVIESASPEVVYVPTYSATVVYGAWPYPAYPPYPVYPYPYGAGLAFATGVAIGAAAGYGGWGCGWGNNEVDVNVSKQNNFTKNNYNRPEQHQQRGDKSGKGQWQHNPQHRGNAQYKDQKTAQKYGQQRSGSGGRATTSDARGYGSGGGQRGGGGPQISDLSRGGGKESAFGGGSGGSERASSNRGSESRSSASRSTSSEGGSKGSGSGGSRSSGGGGSRGGGGGGGRR